MAEDVIALVNALAASQHGVIGLDQFRFLGGTRHQLRQAVQAGWLVMVAPRVYAVAGAPPTVDRLTMTGLLALGPDAVVSHEAAARLHRFDRSASDAVEFTVP